MARPPPPYEDDDGLEPPVVIRHGRCRLVFRGADQLAKDRRAALRAAGRRLGSISNLRSCPDEDL